MMFTCCIRYTVDPAKLAEFREYARAWMPLIEAYGGIHHGYFMPGEAGDAMPEATFSFPGLGKAGPANVAIALFSFPTLAAYEAYRKDVSADPRCQAATARFEETQCFSGYERTFLMPVAR